MPWEQYTRAQIRAKLQDKWEGVPFWSAGEANTAINETLRVWNLLTGMWKRRVTKQTVAGEPWVSVPSTLVYNVKVSWMGHLLDVSSIGDLDNLRPGWDGETTATGGKVPTRPKVWAPAGLNLLAIWPADAVGNRSLVIDGVRQTPVLVADGDFIDCGEHDLNGILGMALRIASFKLGTPLFDNTQRFYQDFLMAAAEHNSRLALSSFFRKHMGLDVNRYQRPLRKGA